MKRTYLFALGCLGLIVLAAVLIGVAIASMPSPSEQAKARWDARGSDSYTLDVSQECTCNVVGWYTITVRDGKVVAAEPVGNPVYVMGEGTLTVEPADFDQVTSYGLFPDPTLTGQPGGSAAGGGDFYSYSAMNLILEEP